MDAYLYATRALKMVDEHPPVELTLIPTSSFSVESSLQKLEAISTRFWAKLEARAVASPPQQESVDQQVNPGESGGPPPSTEGKQAPDLTPLYLPGSRAIQGSAPPRPPHQQQPTVHKIGADPYSPYGRDLVPLRDQAHGMEAPATTLAQA
ncbi:Hypothetical predicted protein [Pelobates cultripes]|uniref:Uncharacterized protein n=1 Tax=Pelobates cultripes TaxID=61616 RepID=A0AAD1VSD0_PELCU|nr:Hypothetical predicted protein [Pelobates cultripes]